MSRVAKIPVTIAKGVEAKIENGVITIKGPKGTLTQKLDPRVEVKIEDGHVHFKALDQSKEANAMSGTLRALVNSMNKGVSVGWSKKLLLVTKVETPTQTEIVIHGADKQQVGQVAAEIRAFRSPEPYKGKGVRYADEHVIIKETKKK